jgi:hypothetical protein
MMMRGEASELTPQGLHFGRTIQSEQSAESSWITLFELLGTLDPKQRHQEQRQQCRAQPVVEGWADFTVQLVSFR